MILLNYGLKYPNSHALALSIAFFLQSRIAVCQYVESTPYFSPRDGKYSFDALSQFDVADSFRIQKIQLMADWRSTTPWALGIKSTRLKSSHLTWMASSAKVQKKLENYIFGIQSNFNDLSGSTRYPTNGIAVSLSRYSKNLKYLSLNYITNEPITWADTLIAKGVVSDSTKASGHWATDSRFFEAIFHLGSSQMAKAGNGNIGRKIDSSFRLGVGPNMVNFKVGAFLERNFSRISDDSIKSFFLRRVSVAGGYSSLTFANHGNTHAIYFLTRYGKGDKLSMIKDFITNELSLEFAPFKIFCVRLGISQYRGSSMQSTWSSSASSFATLRVSL